jgi:hypothetical protein
MNPVIYERANHDPDTFELKAQALEFVHGSSPPDRPDLGLLHLIHAELARELAMENPSTPPLTAAPPPRSRTP